jgi:tubulin polyglutamylase TTLL6/13
MAQPNNVSNDMCFEILGFDFIIDSTGKVFLLEINHTPSFSTDTPLDELIKSNLIKDSLILMNVTP